MLALVLWYQSPETRPGPATTHIAAGEVAFRPIGNFQQAGKAVTPPVRIVQVADFDIMTNLVTRAQYRACVEAGKCESTVASGHETLPQTMISWEDAEAYAAWLSRETGGIWRLPTAEEWQHAAVERFGDAAPNEEDLDPSERMLAQYERGILLRGRVTSALRPVGGYGENSRGVFDMAGNVWEWTAGCMENGTVDAGGQIVGTEPYCGVRIAGGAHRAAVIDFVRDASVGGCAVGLPPDYLGVRLVRDK